MCGKYVEPDNGGQRTGTDTTSNTGTTRSSRQGDRRGKKTD